MEYKGEEWFPAGCCWWPSAERVSGYRKLPRSANDDGVESLSVLVIRQSSTVQLKQTNITTYAPIAEQLLQKLYLGYWLAARRAGNIVCSICRIGSRFLRIVQAHFVAPIAVDFCGINRDNFWLVLQPKRCIAKSDCRKVSRNLISWLVGVNVLDVINGDDNCDNFPTCRR